MEKSNEYSAFAKNVQSDGAKYINNVLASSTNYAQRFITFLFFTQLLYLFLFIVIRLFGWFGWFKAIPVVTLICFGIGVVLLVLFLFKGVNAKALSFFASGIIYLILSILLARAIGTDISITDISFLGGWSAWNMIYSIVILIIGTVRTFLLGFVHDYKK
jgi:hypothetical protein